MQSVMTNYNQKLISTILQVSTFKILVTALGIVSKFQGYHQRWRDYKLPRDYRFLT